MACSNVEVEKVEMTPEGGARKLRLSAVATMAALAHTLITTARTVCPFICVGFSRLSGCDKFVPDWEHLVLVFQPSCAGAQISSFGTLYQQYFNQSSEPQISAQNISLNLSKALSVTSIARFHIVCTDVYKS